MNFQSTTVSYKVHKKIVNDLDDIQIIPNTQEAIIDENTWLRVQELREHRIRLTATGRRNLFSGKVYCYDCKSPLCFCASKSLKENQEYFRCSKYKAGRGECTVHYIREVVLEKIVTEQVSHLADFVRCYESVLESMTMEKHNLKCNTQIKDLQKKIENGKKRVKEIDTIIEKLYEDAMLNKLP